MIFLISNYLQLLRFKFKLCNIFIREFIIKIMVNDFKLFITYGLEKSSLFQTMIYEEQKSKYEKGSDGIGNQFQV